MMLMFLSSPVPDAAAPAQTPRSRPPTPKHVGSPLTFAACGRERVSERKSRKGSLKVCLSKLFRTKSGGSGGSSSSVGHAPNKRPSLASSTSSGGSLMDVWGSGSTDPDTGGSDHLHLLHLTLIYLHYLHNYFPFAVLDCSNLSGSLFTACCFYITVFVTNTES